MTFLTTPILEKGEGRGKELILVSVAYICLTIIATWPLTIHLFDAIAGFEGRDSLQIVWFNWWGVKSLLALAQSPAQLDWLYYPHGAHHDFLLATIFLPLFATPLTLTFGPIPTYNIIVLSSFVLGGILTYLLALTIINNRHAAFVAGLIFVFAPNRMGHVMAGHLLLFVTWSLPLYALALTQLIRQPSSRWMLVGAISLFILTLTQPLHLAYFAVPFSLIYGGGLLITHSRSGNIFKKLWPYIGGMALIAALLLLPFYGPLFHSTWQGDLDFFSNAGLEDHSTDLMAFVLPSPFHPLWGDPEHAPPLLTQIIDSPRDMEERLAYLGLVPLSLALWGLWRRFRSLYLWAVLALVAILFSLGPTLYILGVDSNISLPYTWLMELPFLKWSRTPGRFNETVTLALAILAAGGLSELLHRWQWPYILTGIITLIILFEYTIMYPFPLAGQKRPTFYQELATERPDQPLLDMPVTGSRRASNYSLLYQTIHNRPIAGGYIQRELPGTAELAQFFDRLLSPAQGHGLVAGLPSIQTRQHILRELGIRQVVARRWLMTDQAAQTTLQFMPQVLGSAYYVNDNLLAWQPPPVEVQLPSHTLLLSEKGWEMIDGGLHLKKQGLLFIYTTQHGSATLTVELINGRPGQQLWIEQNGPLAAEGTIRHQISLPTRSGFNWYNWRLTDCIDCRAIFSQISLVAE